MNAPFRTHKSLSPDFDKIHNEDENICPNSHGKTKRTKDEIWYHSSEMVHIKKSSLRHSLAHSCVISHEKVERRHRNTTEVDHRDRNGNTNGNVSESREENKEKSTFYWKSSERTFRKSYRKSFLLGKLINLDRSY